MERKDDFEQRRRHLRDLSEEQLEARFWELCHKLTAPILQTAGEHTTPSIERSVLLRMGFSSLESRSIVQGAQDRGLLEHGAGHLVYKLSRERNLGVREAGLLLAENRMWDEAAALFEGAKP